MTHKVDDMTLDYMAKAMSIVLDANDEVPERNEALDIVGSKAKLSRMMANDFLTRNSGVYAIMRAMRIAGITAQQCADIILITSQYGKADENA